MDEIKKIFVDKVEVFLNKNIIVLNQGFIETLKSSGNPSIRYKDKYVQYIKSYGHEDTFYVNTTKSDTEFSININGMETCSIKVTNGYIGIKAIATQNSKLTAKFGAIEIRLKRSEIGRLYLKVDTGGIIDKNNLIAVNSIGLTGFEGVFNGDLPGQKTEVLVRSGAIICSIY